MWSLLPAYHPAFRLSGTLTLERDLRMEIHRAYSGPRWKLIISSCIYYSKELKITTGKWFKIFRKIYIMEYCSSIWNCADDKYLLMDCKIISSIENHKKNCIACDLTLLMYRGTWYLNIHLMKVWGRGNKNNKGHHSVVKLQLICILYLPILVCFYVFWN